LNLILAFDVPVFIVQTGQLIQARYRCLNEIGWSEFSDLDYLLKAGVPVAPPAPLFLWADSSTVTIQILPTLDNNGAPVSRYQVWRDNGENLNPVQAAVPEYDGTSAVFTVPGLTAGKIYKFSVLAVNSEGESDLSLYTPAAVSPLPNQPVALFKNSKLSNETMISLYWDRVPDADVPTSGYIVEMTIAGSEDFKTVYDGTSLGQAFAFNATGLETNRVYQFRLYALNFNGRSNPSTIFVFNACVAPSVIASPTLVNASTNAITIAWTEPQHNGGCPLTGFAVFRDDGNGGEVSIEVNTDDDLDVRGNSVLKQVTATNFQAGDEGLYFRFKIRAFNREGYVDSTLLKVLNAGRPSVPTASPTLISQSDSSFVILMPTVDAASA